MSKNLEIAMKLNSEAYKTKSKKAFWGKRKKAIPFLRKAAYAGNSVAQFELGQEYEDTGYFGENFKKAFYWYKKAAAQKHAEACNCIGFYYDHGLGVKKNPKTAQKWYRKGAKLGSETAKGNARLNNKKK